MSSIHQTMAFKNEVVSDEDIERYQLPFRKGGGRWWTRDVERDAYLWGGLTGNPAFDEMQEGCFYFYFKGKIHKVILSADVDLYYDNEKSYSVVWKNVLRIAPSMGQGDDEDCFLMALKEALNAYGLDGETRARNKNVIIFFGF